MFVHKFMLNELTYRKKEIRGSSDMMLFTSFESRLVDNFIIGLAILLIYPCRRIFMKELIKVNRHK